MSGVGDELKSKTEQSNQNVEDIHKVMDGWNLDLDLSSGSGTTGMTSISEPGSGSTGMTSLSDSGSGSTGLTSIIEKSQQETGAIKTMMDGWDPLNLNASNSGSPAFSLASLPSTGRSGLAIG